MPRMLTSLASLAGVVVVMWGLLTPASAAQSHPAVVDDDPANYTPQLVPTGAVGQPRTDALAELDGTVFAGGWFESVSQGGTTYDRTNLVAFDASTGAVRSFAPDIDGRVWALAAHGDSVYIGGKFGTVNGLSRPNLVKVDATTGAVDTAFRARLGGKVSALVVSNGRLFAGGGFAKKLTAVNLDTGADTGYVNLPITDPLPNAWGNVAVYALAINPAGTQLVATGNFRTVAGQSRTRLFVADLGASSATLSSWYYDGFAEPCSSTNPRRIAYLEGVDYSPDGSYFVVVSTGQISHNGDLGETVCDAAGRFDLADDSRPAWINYTGGDSLWSVAATGPAVYVQGHNTYLDNEGGWQNHPIPTAVVRRGVGAIHPSTGRALPWNPNKPAQIGGKAFLATEDGLWIGSDSAQIHGEPRRGLAFCPLP
jgi:hypothetical protein